MIEADTGRFNIAVKLRERGDAQIAKLQRPGQIMGDTGGRIARRAGKHIIKARFQHGKGRRAGPDVDRPAHGMEQLAQIIDAVGVIGMIMGDDHRIEMGDARHQQLLAQIRPAIDQHTLAGRLDKARHAAAAVLRIGGVTAAPVAGAVRPADARHTAGGAAAQDGDAHGPPARQPALLNKAWKLAVVVAASSASLTPRRPARKRAVCATKAGSQRLPRIGTGAR